MSFEVLQCKFFDHTRPLTQMSGQEIIDEFSFLGAGFADNTDAHGIKIGLSPELAARKRELQDFIVKALNTVNALSLSLSASLAEEL